MMHRRSFLQIGAGSLLGGLLFPRPLAQAATADPQAHTFQISLAQWSLHHSLRAGKLSNLEFPQVTRQQFDLDCVEYVDQFFSDKSSDLNYLRELKNRAADEGVRNGLIMLDTNGPLGTADETARKRAIDNTKGWMDAARFLGCQAIRINARGDTNPGTLKEHMAASVHRLIEHDPDLDILIENHGGPSSDPAWLSSLMRQVGRPSFGTLPDFGNFSNDVNRYDAVEQLLPFAKAVSAKATRFDNQGRVTDTDFPRMMRLVRDAGYHGYVGVESSVGHADAEAAAIKHTRDALREIQAQQARCQPIFNGRNLEGWSVRHGGQWSVEDGAIVGRQGGGWAHDPENSGSWLSSNEQYSDFRFEFQFMINEGGNSGVFFRASHEKNPAFHGYEFQIHDAHGQPPSKHGPAAIYDLAAPTENRVRPAGQWNTVTLIAQGDRIRAEMNGVPVLDTRLDRFHRGYLGLQIHDEESVVKFRNLRVERLASGL